MNITDTNGKVLQEGDIHFFDCEQSSTSKLNMNFKFDDVKGNSLAAISLWCMDKRSFVIGRSFISLNSLEENLEVPISVQV